MSRRLFGELATGTRFLYRGRVFVKIAKSMAEDDERLGTVFHDQVMVELENEKEPSPETGENPS